LGGNDRCHCGSGKEYGTGSSRDGALFNSSPSTRKSELLTNKTREK